MNKKTIINGIITLSSLALLADCSPLDSENPEYVDSSVQSSIPASESSFDSQMINASEDMYNDMDGVTATIDFAEETTVYMLDYQPTDGGEMVKNHK